MASSVFCTRYSLELNLTLPDLGQPDYPDLRSEIYGDDADQDPEFLQCIQSAQGIPCNAEAAGKSSYMYIQRREGGLVAVHRNPGKHVVTRAESDEHKALKERICKDAEAAGFGADIESRSGDGRRRTDVIVDGLNGIRIGWEPQMSKLGRQAVERRTALAKRDGLTSMWLTKSDKAELINRAPWSRIKETPWREIAAGDPLEIIGGVNRLDVWRCDSSSILPCPVTKSGRCGKFHGRWVAASNIYLNKLVEFTATGEYRELHLKRIPGFRPERYLWAPREEVTRYREITSDDAEESERATPATGDPEVRERPLDPSCKYGEETGFRAPPTPIRDTGEPVPVPHLRPGPDPRAIRRPELLDWSHPSHWSVEARPCTMCGGLTNLRDERARPMHKVCAEAQLQIG
ncbi:competence protein CoiA family protein [Kribbella sp. WER1]